MHEMTKHTAISREVKMAVSERDSVNGHCCCVVCGSPSAQPNAHIVRRSRGGMGVESNIVSLCGPCHYAFDEGIGMSRLQKLGFTCRNDVEQHIYRYIKRHYPDWTPESVTYKKWR